MNRQLSLKKAQLTGRLYQCPRVFCLKYLCYLYSPPNYFIIFHTKINVKKTHFFLTSIKNKNIMCNVIKLRGWVRLKSMPYRWYSPREQILFMIRCNSGTDGYSPDERRFYSDIITVSFCPAFSRVFLF